MHCAVSAGIFFCSLYALDFCSFFLQFLLCDSQKKENNTREIFCVAFCRIFFPVVIFIGEKCTFSK